MHPRQPPIVYIIDGSRALTGAFVSARGIARALGGDASVVLVLASDSDIAPEAMLDFAAVRRLPIRHLRRSFWAAALYLPSLLAASILLYRHMRQDRADVLIVNDFYLMQGAVLRLLGFRGSIITWVRVNPATFGRISSVWLWAAEKTSNKVLSVSHYIERLLPSGFASELLYDYIDPSFAEMIAAEPKPGRTFVFIGNYVPGKGQDVAVDALARVVSYFPDAHIEFHGGDMGLQKNRKFRRFLEERAKSLGVFDHIYFGNFATSPRAVLTGRYAAINLSRSESFSMAVLEASACGLAVIATRSGGPEEIVEDGRTGILVPVDDVQACADAMSRLCADPAGTRRMGQAGRERVLREFSQMIFRNRLTALLELG